MKNLIIKKGDYFDVYKEGRPTERMIAISENWSLDNNNYCDAISIDPVKYRVVDLDSTVECVLGNIYN